MNTTMFLTTMLDVLKYDSKFKAKMLHWEIDDDTVLRVHIDDKDKVAYYFLDTGE